MSGFGEWGDDSSPLPLQWNSSPTPTAAPTTYAPMSSSIETLPQEVLSSIWMRLDSPGSLSMSSSYLCAFGKDVSVQAQFFLFRYPKYEVLYRAIARGRLFSKALFKILMHGGALLSRALAEKVCVAFAKKEDRYGTAAWGRRIDLVTFSAIIQKVEELYGNDFTANGVGDNERFYQWLDYGYHNYESITKLFKEYSFMPFPLPGSDLDTVLSKALRKEPALLPLMQRNGYNKVATGFLDYIVRSIFCRKGSTVHAIVEELQELFQDERYFVSKTIASQIIMSRFKSNLGGEASIPYEALKLLQPFLRFDLTEWVFEVVTTFISKSFDEDIMNFVDVLTPDFPSMPSPFNHYHQLLSIFFKAEKQFQAGNALIDLQNQERLIQLRESVGQIQVTNSHIYALLFSNMIQSCLCVVYAEAYNVGGFSLPLLLLKVLEPNGILSRPHKGRILSELLQLSDQRRISFGVGHIGFGGLLERFIVSKSINIQKLPLGSVRGSTKSILAYDWRTSTRPDGNRQTYNTPPGFQQLWNENLTMVQNSETPTFVVSVSPQALKDLNPPEWDKKKMRNRSDFVEGSFCTIFEARRGEMAGHRVSSGLEVDRFGGCDDVLGRIHPNSISIASACLDYFGALNRTVVPIMLEHAVVNNNSTIIAEYLNKGVSVTLFHFQLWSRLGYAPPEQLLMMIKQGIIFVHAGSKRGVDDSEDWKLLKGRASLDPAERGRLATVQTTIHGRQRGEFTSPTLQTMLQAEEPSSPNYQAVFGYQNPPVADRGRTETEKAASLKKWYEHFSGIMRLEKRKHEIRRVSSPKSKADKTPYYLWLESTIPTKQRRPTFRDVIGTRY